MGTILARSLPCAATGTLPAPAPASAPAPTHTRARADARLRNRKRSCNRCDADLGICGICAVVRRETDRALALRSFNKHVCWHPSGRVLAVTTELPAAPDTRGKAGSGAAGGYVYMYQILAFSSGVDGNSYGSDGGSGAGRAAQAQAREHGPSPSMSNEDCIRLAEGQPGVSISLTQKIKALLKDQGASSAPSSPPRAGADLIAGSGSGSSSGGGSCVAAGEVAFWLGMRHGLVLSINWSAQNPKPQKLYLDGAGPRSKRRAAAVAAAAAAAAAAPGTESLAEGAAPWGDVAALCCCPQRGVIAALDVDGRAALAFGTERGDLASMRTQQLLLGGAHGHGSAASAVCINARQGMLALGLRGGELELYALQTAGGDGLMNSEALSAAHVRSISLAHWGEVPGAVRCAAWSDDGCALAVACRPGQHTSRCDAIQQP